MLNGSTRTEKPVALPEGSATEELSMPFPDPYDRSTHTEFDEDAFEDGLARLVVRAQHADVELQGAYDIRSPQREQPDYTIEVTEITKPLPTN